AHIRFLADDALEGRETGARGYDVAAAYVAAKMMEVGLEPAGTGGEWFQPIRFRSAQLLPEKSAFTIRIGADTTNLEHRKDVLIRPYFADTTSEVSAPVVFAGFGISAPELKHDDYADLDVKGKIVLTVSGAPLTFPSDQRALYSSGEMKEAAAAKRGAVGLISVKSTTDERRFPFEKTARQPNVASMRYLDHDDNAAGVEPRLKVQALLSREAAAKLFAGAPLTLDKVLEDAEKGVTHSFPLRGEVSAKTETAFGEATSRNVAGMLRGSDERRRDEYVLYTAHLDHLGAHGTGADPIYNGALDNGSGIAALLEIARAFASLPKPPARSVLFVAVTGEEKGEQGSQFFAEYPTVPPGSIVADINMDMFQMHYPVADLVALGGEHTTLGEAARRAAQATGFTISPDPQPEEVRFIRSDQYSFVKKGIPAIHLKAGPKSSDPAIDGEKVSREWLRTIYHTVHDDLSQKIDYPSGARYAEANFRLGLEIANAESQPEWKEGDFFGVVFGRR
ncbi:MAG TPA: M28 family metallopeptidase, partial [Thermoanaerobaculia bacterium]|nr:M28 family metallopeptidase [Thermoanaerobaculia bacterium]